MVEKKFRTAINGYNKDDVYKYVDKLALDAEQKLREQEAYMKKTEQELAKIRGEYESVKAECAQKGAEADELREKLAEAERLNAELRQEAEQLAEELREKPDENQAAEQLNEEKRQLEERVHMLEAERDKIPAALIVAQRQADEIIRASQEKMRQYETEMQEKTVSRYRASREKTAQLKNRMEGSVSLLEDMENGVRLAMSKFVQATGQAKRETEELLKLLEEAQKEEQ